MLIRDNKDYAVMLLNKLKSENAILPRLQTGPEGSCLSLFYIIWKFKSIVYNLIKN